VSAGSTGIPASAESARSGDASPTRAASAVPPRAARGGADAEIDRLWLRGDPDALDRAHSRYRSQLESVAYRIVGNRADAEDVVQRIFLALRRARFQGDSSLWTYLYRSAVNGAVNVLRARRRREAAERQLLDSARLENDARTGGPDAEILEGEILAAVAKALLCVKKQHRRVLVLRIIHGLGNTEIAEMEAVPVATVGTWLRRGRRELQRALRPLLRELGRNER
jgi:RNA polymerase sigma-70 factor, ECF subfamily